MAKIEDMKGHTWEKRPDGTVNEKAWGDGDGHGGVTCETCGLMLCLHCYPEPMAECSPGAANPFLTMNGWKVAATISQSVGGLLIIQLPLEPLKEFLRGQGIAPEEIEEIGKRGPFVYRGLLVDGKEEIPKNSVAIGHLGTEAPLKDLLSRAGIHQN